MIFNNDGDNCHYDMRDELVEEMARTNSNKHKRKKVMLQAYSNVAFLSKRPVNDHFSVRSFKIKYVHFPPFKFSKLWRQENISK